MVGGSLGLKERGITMEKMVMGVMRELKDVSDVIDAVYDCFDVVEMMRVSDISLELRDSGEIVWNDCNVVIGWRGELFLNCNQEEVAYYKGGSIMDNALRMLDDAIKVRAQWDYRNEKLEKMSLDELVALVRQNTNRVTLVGAGIAFWFNGIERRYDEGDIRENYLNAARNFIHKVK